jgi:hypothetical protein
MLGYFIPVFLELLPDASPLLWVDKVALERVLPHFGISVIPNPHGLQLVKDNKAIASYALACSSLRGLMFALFPLVCNCPWKRRIMASALGTLMGMPIPWIRLWAMLYIEKFSGLSIELLHFTISPFITFVLGILVFFVQGYVCNDVLEELIGGADCFESAWKDCKKLKRLVKGG